jgi:four helix bundle protein
MAKLEKPYDLGERTYQFAQRCRHWVKKIPRSLANIEDGKQLVRSSGSVAANYIEANEALSRKDFVMRIKISRKEAKESHLWLRLCDIGPDPQVITERQALLGEAMELGKIFGAIIEKSRGPQV